MIVPSARLVAVRMRDPERTSWDADELVYRDFVWDVLAVAGLAVEEGERR